MTCFHDYVLFNFHNKKEYKSHNSGAVAEWVKAGDINFTVKLSNREITVRIPGRVFIQVLQQSVAM